MGIRFKRYGQTLQTAWTYHFLRYGIPTHALKVLLQIDAADDEILPLGKIASTQKTMALQKRRRMRLFVRAASFSPMFLVNGTGYWAELM